MKKKIRFIPRLDLKNDKLIKSIQLEGLRVIGSPYEYAYKYYKENADELIFLDSVASLYSRKSIISVINEVTKNIFIPITVGGGIRSLKDVETLLTNGADKVAINTGAVENPKLLSEISKKYGNSTLILSLEIIKVSENKWEILTNKGREKTGIDPLEWVKKTQDLGIGEIFITSINQEGTKRGFDIKLIERLNKYIYVPLTVSGGMGSLDHLNELCRKVEIDAVAIASILHYKLSNIQKLKKDYYES